MITQQELLRDFKYDPQTGELRWNVKRCGAKCGEICGSEMKGYLRVVYNYRSYMVHRIIWMMMYGEWPEQVDHINGNKKDNRLVNLRNVSTAYNCQNQGMRKDKKWKAIPGVYYQPDCDVWRVRLKINGTTKNFGSFKDKDEAEAHCINMRRIHYPGNTL